MHTGTRRHVRRVAPGGTLLVIARATDEEEIPYATRR